MRLRKKVSGSTYHQLIEFRRSTSGSIFPVEFKFAMEAIRVYWSKLLYVETNLRTIWFYTI